MKKLVLFVMAVMAFAGMSVAQDIYTAGYYTNSSGNHTAAVYKNGTKWYEFGSGSSYTYESNDVACRNGDVYWIWNAKNSSSNTILRGVVKKNNTIFLDEGGDYNYEFTALDIDHDGWVAAAGYKMDADHSNLYRAALWQCSSSGSTSATVHYLGNTDHSSYAYDVDWYNDNTYCSGIQYTASSVYKGVVWKGLSTTPYLELPSGFNPRAIAVDVDGTVYTAGNYYDGSTWTVRVYENTSLKWTLSSSNSRAWDIQIDASGDIYVTGWEGADLKVWKNGASAYSISASGAYSRAVVANSNGVYNAGSIGSVGKIWKNGSVLYSPTNCEYIYGMYIDEPECTNSEVRSLPFNETFENGNTSWPCWTTLDLDGDNGTDRSYWHRTGRRLNSWMTGNYGARHAAHSGASQNGLLITPRLFLQPGQDYTNLSFDSWVGSSGFDMCVMISTNSNPTSTSSYSTLFVEHQNGGSVQNYNVDLSAYQGQAVYIAFQYYGTPTTSWLIDNVSVTEGFQPCTGYSAPYSNDFSDGFGSCFTALDVDMSGGMRCWQPSTNGGYQSTGCLCHPYGQNGVAQTGWLYSTRVNLPSGNYNYTLSFKTKNSSSGGTGETHTAWVAVDKTGPYLPTDYTQIWQEPSFNSSWTTYTVDLTQYKGHTVSIAFKYVGTYAHNWYVDDFAITKETAEYTITANANNNSWGTVSGGGSYASGATCTLVATPASGYQFDSWKKNGSVVSTNATYNFTVSENATYTAYFSETPITYYNISTEVTPANAGTVSGGGQHAAGSSITLTATANPGYTFAHWQDGNTQNPRTVTVTSNATYTATFTQNQYQITTNVSPAGAGTVTGGGAYHYGDIPTLTATANANYEFAGWNDGNTENPRTITVTGNETYTAIFNEVGTTYFNVTANVVPTGAGTVSGTGSYEAGSVITLHAIANPGYTFDHWSDGSTANPRSVTVNNDLNFTAYFIHNSYTITVNASPAGAGSVSGGGSYYYGDYATLSATAYSGYEFVGWSDGSSENPHQVLVTGNATYTATFSEVGTTYYTVSAYVSPKGAGTVSGTGTFPAGASTTLTATANSGYTFDHWNDGSTQNPRTVTVNNNMSFTAYFNTQEYTITTNVTPAGAGTVTGGGTFAYGAMVMLTATPNTGYEFLQWSDGNMQNPRIITVTGNATYTALFSDGTGDMFTLTVTSNFPLLGQVFGGGTYPAGSEVEISAYPNSYARFVKWSDGNTENPRTVVVNSDMEFVAEFVATQNYTITVESANPEMGQAFGGGTFQEGTEVQIAAVAFGGYMFEKWQDGNTENPRTILVSGDATYTAHFVENVVVTYTITLISNTDEGTVSGGGTYISGTQAVIQAFPNEGYVFTKWSDNSTDNPRVITVDGDLTLVAFFATGVGENEQANLLVFPNPAKESIRILGIEANTQVEIYNSLGELVKVVSANPDQEIGIRDLASGLYLVRCGNVTMRFVKEQ